MEAVVKTEWDKLCDRYRVAMGDGETRAVYWRAYPGWRDRAIQHRDPSSLADYVHWWAARP
jgi:hypothetical protein